MEFQPLLTLFLVCPGYRGCLSLKSTACAGPLDSLYFYIYGCQVDSNSILALGNIPGFLFTSDKSLTEIHPSPTSLLLANFWTLDLLYNSSQSCEFDEVSVKASEGCVLKGSCNKDHAQSNHGPDLQRIGPTISPRLSVGCGSLTCSGCVLEDFFRNFTFSTAIFDLNSVASGFDNSLNSRGLRKFAPSSNQNFI